MTKEDEGFSYLRQKFPGKSEAKIKEGVFVSPQQLLSWSSLHNKLNTAERRVRDAIESVCSNFLRSKKSENYVEIVAELLFRLPRLVVQHVVETPFPAIPLEFFPGNYGIRLWRAWWKVPSGYIPHGKKDTAANETQICWLITAGRLYGRHQQKNIRHYNKTSFFMLHLFIVR